MGRLDDTSRCPVADACASCGGQTALAVVTAQTQVGVHCLTLCASCSDEGRVPGRLSVFQAMEAAMAHCGHVGIDADEAAAILDAERTKEGS